MKNTVENSTKDLTLLQENNLYQKNTLSDTIRKFNQLESEIVRIFSNES